jgi:diguanylate cyclase (GGDEF)-like protein
MISRLKKLLHWGCAAASTHTQKRKILHANITAFVTTLTMAAFGTYNLALGNPALLKVALSGLPFYATCAAVFWLNRRGQYGAASWVMALSLTSCISVIIFTVYGSAYGVHFYFILFALLAVAYFPLSSWKAIVFQFLVNVSLFFYCEFHGVATDAVLLDAGESTLKVIRASFAASIIVSLFILVWLGEIVASRNERELESLSGTDVLTRLPNRRRLHQRLADIIAHSKRTGEYGAVLFIDLDNFKPLNDQHGHSAGDQLLQEAAQRISDCVREVDMVSRYGGDEFVVLLGHLGREHQLARDNAHQIAEKVRHLLGRPYELAIHVRDTGSKRVEHRCTSSIGVTLFQGGGTGEEHIIKCADAAMYRAKSAGRNAISFH